MPTDISGPPAGWTTLNITLTKPALYCAYVTRWGMAGQAAKIGATANGKFNMTAAPASNWYYVIAECDWDNSAVTNEFWFVRSDVAGRQVVDRKK